MTAAAVLFSYAYAALIAGPRLLTRTRWLLRAPRIGIAVWFAWMASLWLAVVLGGLVLVVPVAMVSHGLGGLLDACVLALQSFYAAPGGSVGTAVGAVIAAAMLARLAYSAVIVWRTARQQRHVHHDALTLLGRPCPRTGSVIVDDVRPAAYCVPGRPHRVVLTTAALAALDDDQLNMVLAHERAHLRGRHHLLLAAVGALQHAYPLPPLRTAAQEIARLVEMLADDHAHQGGDRIGLAEALLTMAAGPARAPALGVADTCVESRVRRLLTPHRPLSILRYAALVGGTVAAIAVPAFVAGQPALSAHQFTACPPGMAAPPLVDLADCTNATFPDNAPRHQSGSPDCI